MRLKRLPPLAVLLGHLASAACSDPSVTITFNLPDEYRRDVTSVSLQILVPPVAEPFTCDDLAFQSVPEIAVAASRAQDLRLPPRGDLDIRGIPRLGRKLFLARGLDDEDVPIVAACRELDDITDDVAIRLDGEPVVVLTTQEVAAGNPLPQRVSVLVTDTGGKPMPQVAVRWTVTAPGGALPPEGASTGSNGRLEIDTPADLLPGPVALDVSARWQRFQAASVVGFTEPPILFQDELPGDAPDVSIGRTEALYEVGRIGPQGEVGFAALGPSRDLAVGRQVYIAYRPESPPGAPFHVAVSAPLLNVFTLGLAADAAAQRERVVAINGFQLIDIDPVDGSASQTLLTPSAGSPATRILPGGACDTDDNGRNVLLVSLVNDAVVAYDDAGKAIASPFATDPPTARPIASGCVHDIEAKAHRTVVYAGEGFQQHLVTRDAQGVVRRGNWATYAAGVGFMPAVSEGESRYLLGPSITIAGTAIARYRLVPLGAGNLDLELATQDDSPTVFWSANGGNLDGDGTADVVALLDFGTTEGSTEFRFLVALGVDHRGQRLVGLSPAGSAPYPRLFAADFDHDGAEDILLATPLSVTIFRTGARP